MRFRSVQHLFTVMSVCQTVAGDFGKVSNSPKKINYTNEIHLLSKSYSILLLLV